MQSERKVKLKFMRCNEDGECGCKGWKVASVKLESEGNVKLKCGRCNEGCEGGWTGHKLVSVERKVMEK